MENSKLDDEVIISKNASFQKGSSIYLKENQVYTIRDLVYGMLLRSGNDAAVALAEHISGSEKEFTKLMNKKLNLLSVNTIMEHLFIYLEKKKILRKNT